MTSSHVATPLRIPELGPSLGQLVTGTELRHVGLTLDAHRLQLVTRIIEQAGEARRLSAGGERSSAVAALNKRTWLEAWEDAVAGVGRRLTETIEKRLLDEARAVRMPRRRFKRVAMTEVERRALTARLGATGAGLIQGLRVVEEKGARVILAGNDPQIQAEWQRALQGCARRLEAAWLALETAVDREIAYWQRTADAVAAWRKPWWPVLVTGGVGTALAIWLGLMLGGYVQAPAWLEPYLRQLLTLLPPI